MKPPKAKTIFKAILIAPVVIFALAYIAALIAIALDDTPQLAITAARSDVHTVAIFGASGTAGDGILKASMADPTINKIHVITRRITPRMAAGVASGKVIVTQHLDYLDYKALHSPLAESKAVFWAIGLSSIGVDQDTYRKIHADFPVAFVKTWLRVSEQTGLTFHYISSSDISADSRSMWAREKVRAENALFALATDTALKVIAYRPDYIGPTREEAHLGQDLLYALFAPVKAAVRARRIGEAMLEVTARIDTHKNGDKLTTRRILQLSNAYSRRLSQNELAPTFE